jgi:hypothetical protein
MPISPRDYAKRAAELEELAAAAADTGIKREYLEVARELRVLASEYARFEQPSDEEIERLAERMTGNAANKL